MSEAEQITTAHEPAGLQHSSEATAFDLIKRVDAISAADLRLMAIMGCLGFWVAVLAFVIG